MFDNLTQMPTPSGQEAAARNRHQAPPSLNLIASVALIVSLAVALTVVSIGIARARAPVASATELVR